MAASEIPRTLRIIPLCWLILPGGLVLAQGRASSTDEINRALGFDNRNRSNLLPSTGGNGKPEKVANPLGDTSQSADVTPPTVKSGVLPSDPSALRQWTSAIAAAIRGRMNPGVAAGTDGGTAVIRFTVLRSGEVKDVGLVRSSGIGQIDRAALALVQKGLPVAPEGVTQQSLSVSLPLNYRVRTGQVPVDDKPSGAGVSDQGNYRRSNMPALVQPTPVPSEKPVIQKSPPASSDTDQDSAFWRAKAFVREYAARSGETPEQFSARLGSPITSVEGQAYAMIRIGKDPTSMMRSLEGFNNSMKNPLKRKLVDCILEKSEYGPPPSSDECASVKKQLGL